MTADNWLDWPLAWDDYHRIRAERDALRAEVAALEARIDRIVHDGLVICAHDGKHDNRVGKPLIVRVLLEEPIPWEHISDEVHSCENHDPAHRLQVPPKGCVHVAAWAPDGRHDDGAVAG